MSRMLFASFFLFSSFTFAQQKIDFDLSKVKSVEPTSSSKSRVPLPDLTAEVKVTTNETKRNRAVVDRVLQNTFEDRSRYEEGKIQLYKWEQLEGTPFEIGAGLNRSRVGFYPYRRLANRAEISLRMKFPQPQH